MVWGFPNRCSCGARIRARDKFCAYCGERQEPRTPTAERTCGACSAPMAGKWLFCPECGTRRDVDVMKSGYDGEHVHLTDFKHALRILLLTDLHITEGASSPTLVGKLTHTNRCFAKILETFDGSFDQLLITGDVVDRASVGELDAFFSILSAHHLLYKTTLIPGNHDLVLKGKKRTNLEHFDEVLGKLPGHPREGDGFPFIRHLGNQVVAVGLDSTGVCRGGRRATQLLLNGRGKVDDEQLERLEGELRRIPSDVLKIVMTHHRINQMPKTHGIWKRLKTTVVDGWLMSLVGAERLKEILTTSDNVLLVHGHHHVEHVDFPRKGGLLATVGLPSSTHPDKFDGVFKLFMLVVQPDWLHILRVAYDGLDALRPDLLDHLRLVRSFELKRGRTPEAVRRVLAKSGFQRDKSESDLLGRWATGGFDPEIAAILRRPNFLRSAEDRNLLRAAQLI